MLLRPATAPLAPAVAEKRWRWQVTLPAWLVSLMVHALLVILLGYVAGQQVHGTNAPANAVLIASYSTSPTEKDYFDDERSVEVAGAESASGPKSSHSDDSASEAAGVGLAEIANGPPPVDTSSALPSTEVAAANPGEAMAGTATGAGDFGNGRPRPASIRGKLARTHVYGVPGEGNTFVYVFDRSSSMGTGAGSPLESAKRELLASLDDLGEENHFQIIFYNQQPTAMNLGRTFAGL